MTIELEIVKGLSPFNGGALESGFDPINLLSPTGISLAPNGWTPSFPPQKGSSIWIDNPMTDGRVPLSLPLGNVVENMVINANGATPDSRRYLIRRLILMAKAANDLNPTYYQSEPVYLKWRAQGAPGPQYALIYNIEFASNTEAFAVGAVEQLTITIEREGGWRKYPPGDSPVFNAAMVFDGTVFNQCASYDAVRDPAGNMRNYVDITADQVPGDLPALTYIFLDVSSYYNVGEKPIFFVSRHSKRAQNGIADPHVTVPQLMLSAPEGTLGTDAALVTDEGAVFDPANIVPPYNSHVSVSFATATNAKRLTFSLSATNPLHYYRGRYMAFLRCYQTGGSAGQITLYLTYGQNDAGGMSVSQTPVVSPVVKTLSLPTDEWPTLYLGVINLPTDGKAGINLDGFLVPTQLDISVWAARSTGSGVLRICDLVLVPIDEPTMMVLPGGGVELVAIDNTGAFTRGIPEPVVKVVAGSGSAVETTTPELRGQPITLLPGVDQRLYVWGLFNKANTPSVTGWLTAVRVYIVPRWRGVRDV